MSEKPASNGTHYLVGGGIASLATAVFLIRDAKVPGQNIQIFEALDRPGGSLDGSGDPARGYLVRGGRMFEPHFACTFDLLSSIPSMDNPGQSVTDDILAFNRAVPGSSNCRMVRGGEKADVSRLGLGLRDILNLNRLLLRSERRLEGRTIGSCFSRSFFDTNFWLMWSTMFSFQPWHSAIEMRRYLRRFIHLFPGFRRIEGILRTRYNQYDSIISPIVQWLVDRGVQIKTGIQVSDVAIVETGATRSVTKLEFETGAPVEILPQDRVYLTLGSMTDASTTGSNEAPPAPHDEPGGAWQLWRRLAARHSGLGNPDAFCGDPAKTSWQSFTVTLPKPEFQNFMERYTGNATGTGGLVTFADSGWLMSIVMFHPPHFKEQADDAFVFWGYGLRGDRPGDFIAKPMMVCSGKEILIELAGQLRRQTEAEAWFKDATIVPCQMPYITSQFMPRSTGDRPAIRPTGAANFAVIGQFCEIARDTVFTVEYSVRAARCAVHEMTGKGNPPPPVVRTDRNPLVLLRAARTLFGT